MTLDAETFGKYFVSVLPVYCCVISVSKSLKTYCVWCPPPQESTEFRRALVAKQLEAFTAHNQRPVEATPLSNQPHTVLQTRGRLGMGMAQACGMPESDWELDPQAGFPALFNRCLLKVCWDACECALVHVALSTYVA